MAEIQLPIISVAGVQPITDSTGLATQHYVSADKIRFVNGLPEKIGGWRSLVVNNNLPVNGCCRSIFSYNLSGNIHYILGTHSNLYYLLGSQLTNISPLVTATTAIANSLDSNYGTLANDPIATVISTNNVTVTDTATKVRVGDTIVLSGSTAVNGIPAVEINASHFVRTQSTNSYTFIVATNATSTGSGGGAAVVQATPIVTVNQTAHDFAAGDRVGILAAVGFAGIPAGDLNKEHIIRNIATNTYDIVVNTVATSSVTGGGGASTTVQGQIAEGLCDATAAQGYGAGLYGVGLYGTALSSSTGEIPVRSWVADRFGDNVILTAGQQTSIYSWDSEIVAAPIILANAPIAVNYVYTSNSIVVALGSSGVGNRRKWSDQGNSTIWTDLATNQAGEDDIEGASDFISHLNVRGINLEFTESQVWTSRYIGKPFIWQTKLLDNKSGIIAKNARVEHNGIGYWAGSDNFYMYRAGNVEILWSNSTQEATIKRFIFDNINLGQKSKIFCWYNRDYNEIWFHFPSANSNEPDVVARVNVKDFTWVADTHDRSAGEYPTVLDVTPYLAKTDSTTSTIYKHELGNDDDTVSMPWEVKTSVFDAGVDTVNITGIIPDSIQTGDVTLTVDVQQYPQSDMTYGSRTLTVSPDTTMMSFRENSRYIQYTFAGNELDQVWRSGNWQALVAKGGRR